MNTVVFRIWRDSAMKRSWSWRRIRGSRALNGSSISRMWIARQRPGQADALLHAAGQLLRPGLAPFRQLHQLELPLRRGDPLVAREAAELEAERDIVDHVEVRQQGEILEHHADLLGLSLRMARCDLRPDVLALDEDAAGGRLDQPVDVPDEGGFAAAGQAHDAEDLAWLDGEADVMDANDAVEAAI